MTREVIFHLDPNKISYQRMKIPPLWSFTLNLLGENRFLEGAKKRVDSINTHRQKEAIKKLKKILGSSHIVVKKKKDEMHRTKNGKWKTMGRYYKTKASALRAIENKKAEDKEKFLWYIFTGSGTAMVASLIVSLFIFIFTESLETMNTTFCVTLGFAGLFIMSALFGLLKNG